MNISDYINEGIIDVGGFATLVTRLRGEMLRQHCKDVSVTADNNTLKMVVGDSFSFNDEVQRAINRWKINVIEVELTKENSRFDIVSAKDKDFRVSGPGYVLLGGYYKLKSNVVNCTIHADRIVVEENDANKKNFTNVTIEAKLIQIPYPSNENTPKIFKSGFIGAKCLEWSFASFDKYKFGGVLTDDIYDWTKYKSVDGQKLPWSPVDAITIGNDIEYVLFNSDIIDLEGNGALVECIPEFYKKSGGKYGGYELKLVPEDSRNKHNLSFKLADI